MQVRIIPLADKGFVPISETNRVRYYIESVSSGKLVSQIGYDFYEIAKDSAEHQGLKVIE